MQHIQQKAREVASKEIALKAQGERALAEQERIQRQLSEHQLLLTRKDEMLETLQTMQVEAQAKNKGLYEELLTSLIQEVIPGKDDQIVLTNSMKNNRATLDIDVMSNGNLENVYHDKGGSISNIVAMGLRFIVLARHPNRRVLMLDEADCHLRTEYIPAFAAVMNQLSIKLGIQVIYISHHPVSHFVGFGRVIELFKEGEVTHSRTLSDEVEYPPEYEAPDSAFKYIRLRNYGPHQNLLVDLCPGVNIITGNMDLGKSKLIQAVVDLCENRGHEGRIYHHQGKKKPKFEVELGLEEGMALKWGYSRTAKKRTSLELFDAEGQVIESSEEGNAVADWLHTYLAMSPVNGENIHFHSQKKNSYLLSDEFSSIERAQMLPLGRESRDVLRMIQLFNQQLSESRQEKVRLEKELNVHQNTLAAMSLVMDNPVDPILLQERCDELLSKYNKTYKMGSMVEEMEQKRILSAMYDISVSTLGRQVVVVPELLVTQSMRDCIESLEVLTQTRDALAEMENIKPALPAPTLSNLKEITATGVRLSTLKKKLDALSELDKLESSVPFELKVDKGIEKTLENLSLFAAKVKEIDALIKSNNQKKKGIQEEIENLIAEAGGLCPTCDKPFEGHAHD